jgi:mono/diheme cytochrome c family protein
MKGHLAALAMATAAAALLGVSLSDAQQSNASPPKSNKNNSLAYSELDKAPEKARLRINPLASDPEAPMAGRKLFELHCAECHGDGAEGGHHAPSLRAPEVQQAPPGAIFWILTNGIVWHGMPVWSKLPEPQRWQLVSYIKSLGAKTRSAAAEVAPAETQPALLKESASPHR